MLAYSSLVVLLLSRIALLVVVLLRRLSAWLTVVRLVLNVLSLLWLLRVSTLIRLLLPRCLVVAGLHGLGLCWLRLAGLRSVGELYLGRWDEWILFLIFHLL